MTIRVHWAFIAFVLGALLNATVQLSQFDENWRVFRQYENTFGEFIRQFSWLMMIVTGLFFALIGTLVQRRIDERKERAEIEAYREGKRARQ